MSANCDYVYLEGLRFETGDVEIFLPLEEGSSPEGAPAPVSFEPVRLVKAGPAGGDPEKGTVSIGMLKQLVGRGEKVRARVLGRDGKAMAYLQLAPHRCEGRGGRKAFSSEELTRRLGSSAIDVAREQLRTLPYGRVEARGARKRLGWSLQVVPDGEAGLMALTGSAPHLAGMLATGAGFDMLKKRPRDVALLRATLPILAATLELSAEEAADLDRSLAACEESSPSTLASRVSTFGGSKHDSAFGHVSDPALLGDVVGWLGKEEFAAVEEGVRHELSLGALDRLAEIYVVASRDSEYRRGRTMYQEMDRNRVYATFFNNASPATVRDMVQAEIQEAVDAIDHPGLVARAFELEWFSAAALATLGEDGVRDLLEGVRSSDPTGEAIARIASHSKSAEIRALAAANG